MGNVNNNKAFFTVEEIRYYPYHVEKNLKLLYVVRGSVEINNVAGNTLLNEGDIEFINIDEPTEIISLKDDNIVITLTISRQYLAELDEAYIHAIYNANSVQFFPREERNTNQTNQENLKTLKKFFLNLYLDYSRRKRINEENLMVFVNIIVRCFNDVAKHLNCFPNVDNCIIQRFCRLEEYMIDNLKSKIRLTDFAATEYLSPQYLSTEIKNKFGITFGAMLEYYRVRNAVSMMIGKDIKIQEVIRESGFSDGKYFYRAFRTHMLCTPAEFKKRLINNSTIITQFYKEDSPELTDLLTQKGNSKRIPLENVPWIASLHLEKISENVYLGVPNVMGNVVQRFCMIIGPVSANLRLNAKEQWLFHDGDSFEVQYTTTDCEVSLEIGVLGKLLPFVYLDSEECTIKCNISQYGFSLFSRVISL